VANNPVSMRLSLSPPRGAEVVPRPGPSSQGGQGTKGNQAVMDVYITDEEQKKFERSRSPAGKVLIKIDFSAISRGKLDHGGLLYIFVATLSHFL